MARFFRRGIILSGVTGGPGAAGYKKRVHMTFVIDDG
jgi:hypothetical protein